MGDGTVDYREMVRKARELRKLHGDAKFRELYENRPSTLLADMDVKLPHSMRAKWGYAVLQAFDFYPLQQAGDEIWGRILREHASKPLHSGTLGPKEKNAQINTVLHILEQRGLVRLEKRKLGAHLHLLVSEVFKDGRWHKAKMP